MAGMIQSESNAIARVRAILDRADSPWLTDTEIKEFIAASINEYCREITNAAETNQKIRDDLGGYVKTVTFSNEPTDDSDDDTQTFRRQFVNFDSAGAWDTSTNMELEFPGGEWAITETSGTGCYIGAESIGFGTLLELKIIQGTTLRECKSMSIDDMLRVSRDPFHAPTATTGYHAVRVNDYYWIRPGLNATSYQASFTYISNHNDSGAITWLPKHSREEVCQIAARKILGTVADERYQIGDNEIKQLEGK